MTRDDYAPSAVQQQHFDLIVVGGGIYGAFTAREAAQQGLSVCLVEAGDFGASTSSNSLKIIHGGLRYLQNLDFKRMRESIRERRAMHRLAPQLVHPVPFVIPCYGHWLRGREIMAGAFVANELISIDRNRGVLPERKIPRAKTISARRLKQLLPGLAEQNSTGGAIWYDGQASNTERLAMAVLDDARRAGATLLNYVQAKRLVLDRNRVCGLMAHDRIVGADLQLRAKLVVNACGPWVDRFLEASAVPSTGRLFHPSKAMNLVTRKLFDGYAAAIPFESEYDDAQAVFDKKKLHFFVVPWKQYSLIGTRHLPWNGRPEGFEITRDDVLRFLGEVNAAYPDARLTPSDVYRVYGGILPALPRADDGDAKIDDLQSDTQIDDVQIEKQYTLLDHASQSGPDGLISIVGVKWTTARDVAERAVRVALRKLDRRYDRSRSSNTLSCARFQSMAALRQRLAEVAGGRYPDDLLERLAQSHGSNAVDLLGRACGDEWLGTVIETDGGNAALAVEIEHAVRNESANRLDDVLLRRTELCIGGHPGRPAIEAVAAIYRRLTGISAAELSRQTDGVERALERPWIY